MIVDERTGSLEEQVYERLEDEIISGELKSGQVVTECELASRLGVSRTPVRGALRRLAEEGLVEIATNRRVTVVGVGKDDLVDTYNIRMRLEGLSSRLAAERITDEEKKKLTDFVELSEYYISKKDTEHLGSLDTEFHSMIYKASGNRMLCRILSELHRNIARYRRISLSAPGRLEKSVEEHREILDAILAGDGEKADKLTSAHIGQALLNIKNTIN